MKKGSKDRQSGEGKLSYDKASNAMEKQSHQFSLKDKLHTSLVLSYSSLSIRELQTLTADLERRLIEAFENKCCRRMLDCHTENIKRTN